MDNKRGLIIRLAAVVFIAILSVSGILVLGYHTFFPAKLTLMTASYINNRKLYDTLDKNITLYEEKYIKPLLESTIQKEITAGLNVDKELLSLFLPEGSADEIRKHIRNIALKYDHKIDMENKKQSVRIGLNYLLNPILTLRMSLEDKRFAVGIDELTNKTVTGNIKDLGSLSRFLPDTRFSGLWNYLENLDPWIVKEIMEEVRIDRKDLKEVVVGYSRDIFKAIDPEDMTIKRSQATTVLDEEVKCHEITIRLDGKDQRRLASVFLEKLKSNDAFYNLFYGNLNKYLSILIQNPFFKDYFDSGELEDLFSKGSLLSAFEKELDSIEKNPDATIKIYIDGFDIVKYEVTTHINDDPEPFVITNELRLKGCSFDLRMTAKGNLNGNGEFKFRITRDYDEHNDLSDLTMKFGLVQDDPDNMLNFSFSIDSKEESAGKNEVGHTIDFTMKAESPASLTDDMELKITLDGTKIRNAKKQVIESDYDGDISISIPFMNPDHLSLGFYFKTESIYGEEFEIPEPDEVFDIKTATQEEFDQLIDEITSRLEALQQFLGAF
ncbi:MAG TPA: hypothetical protein GXX26_01510 [Clostridiaceae bacterium]|nr:hypothetical protein [Clostridiaceae bacterium]